MLSLNELREELLGVVPNNDVLEFLGKNVTCLFVGKNLAYALENAGEKVVNMQFCKVWVTNYEGELFDSLLRYTLDTTDLQDFNIQVCKVVSHFEVYNRKNGRLLFKVPSKRCTDLVNTFKQYFKDFKSWEEVALHLENGISCTLSDGYLLHANSYRFTNFDEEILSVFNEDLEEYDYDNLYREHIYCSAPEILLCSEEFKAQEEDEAINLGREMPDYVIAWLVSDFLAEKLVDAGEFVVRLDDCNVWESESDNYDLRGQLKYILERYKTRLLDLCVNVCYTVHISYR